MSSQVLKNNHPIDKDTRSKISQRYKRITRAVNIDFWDSSSETDHSRYVGSYGRGTAINTSDLDVLMLLPDYEYEHFSSLAGNGQSRLLQVVKSAILDAYPNTDVRGDGQVVTVKFSDCMRFEVLPAFRNTDWSGNWNGTYKYPDSHMGGNWMSTNPLAEQDAMDEKDGVKHSNGLLKDTCKHIRYIKATEYPNSHLSGILIDSFVYLAIGSWRWPVDDEKPGDYSAGTYEQRLLDYFNKNYPLASALMYSLSAPGSGMMVDGKDLETLGKVLKQMV